MIKVYTKDSCSYCDAVKKLLDNKGVEYEEINIEKDVEAKKELTKKGYSSVPVTLTPAGEEIIGFDLEKIMELV